VKFDRPLGDSFRTSIRARSLGAVATRRSVARIARGSDRAGPRQWPVVDRWRVRRPPLDRRPLRWTAFTTAVVECLHVVTDQDRAGKREVDVRATCPSPLRAAGVRVGARSHTSTKPDGAAKRSREGCEACELRLSSQDCGEARPVARATPSAAVGPLRPRWRLRAFVTLQRRSSPMKEVATRGFRPRAALSSRKIARALNRWYSETGVLAVPTGGSLRRGTTLKP